MALLRRFQILSAHEQALVSLAVLLDGYDAADYLATDKEKGAVYSRIAKELAGVSADTRSALLGTLLRLALEKQ